MTYADAQARRDVPIDGADVVSRLVLAHLGELDASATEGAGVLPGHDVSHQMAGRDLDAPHLAHDLLGGHGTGTVSKILASRASGPIAFGVGAIGQQEPVTQQVEAQRLDVLGHDVGAALQEGVRLGGADQIDRRLAARRRTR